MILIEALIFQTANKAFIIATYVNYNFSKGIEQHFSENEQIKASLHSWNTNLNEQTFSKTLMTKLNPSFSFSHIVAPLS